MTDLSNVNGIALDTTETKMCLATNAGLFYSTQDPTLGWSVPIRTGEQSTTKYGAVALSTDGQLGVTCTDASGTGLLYIFNCDLSCFWNYCRWCYYFSYISSCWVFPFKCPCLRIKSEKYTGIN